MNDLQHHSFKKIYYIFAFAVLFFVATVLGYMLFSSLIAKDSTVGTSVTEEVSPTPELDETKSSEAILDQEVDQAQDVLNDSDFSSVENEDLSGLE